MSHDSRLHLFDAYGVEVEYMVVDRDTLDVRPIVPELIAAMTGRLGDSDHEDGDVTWSNELVAHVVELKASRPLADLRSLGRSLQTAVAAANDRLAPFNAMLLGTAMHPWMNPAQETVLWPYENHEIYAAFDAVFDCRRHGWANVQSVHLNLPFCGDDEFARLHTAIRVVLPLLPAIAAASPIVDGRPSGVADTRLVHYRDHCRRVPSIVGDVIPESIHDEATYRRDVFATIFRDIAPHDPAGVLGHEFLNARGAIARFDRGSIEIRLLDVQEHPAADVAICSLVAAVVRGIVERIASSGDRAWQTPAAALPGGMLVRLLDATIRDGDAAVLDEPDWLRVLGVKALSATAGQVWSELIDQAIATDQVVAAAALPIDVIRRHGTLSRRITRIVGPNPSRDRIGAVTRSLAQCLATGTPLV